MAGDLDRSVRAVLDGEPGVRAVRLVGSRARGTATALSDWDFHVDVADFPAVAAGLPRLVEPLRPLARLWDPLSRHHVFALMLPGPVKVDLLFDVPHEVAAPWHPGPDTLPDIDAHFWDWTLWLISKRYRGESRLVSAELEKMHRHLLEPLGAGVAPTTLEEAVAGYVTARDRTERRFGVRAARAPQRAVESVLRADTARRLGRFVRPVDG
jgi:predicted nucleotidyltransferase